MSGQAKALLRMARDAYWWANQATKVGADVDYCYGVSSGIWYAAETLADVCWGRPLRAPVPPHLETP